MVAIGKVVFTSREHIIALEARDKGLLGVTLRYPYEVRKEAEYFDDIPDEKIPKDMLELATHIVESKAGHFEPERFEDQYEDALKELLKKKQSGQKIEAPREREPPRSSTSWMRYAARGDGTRWRRTKKASTRATIALRRRPAGLARGPRKLDSLFEEQLSNAAGNSLASRSYGRRTSHQDQQRRQTDPMDYVSF